MAMLGYEGMSGTPRITQEGTDPSQMFGASMGGEIMRQVIPAGLGVLAGIMFGGSPIAMGVGGAIGGGVGGGIIASGSEPGTPDVYQQAMQGGAGQPMQSPQMQMPQAPPPAQDTVENRLSSLVQQPGGQQGEPQPEEDPSGYASAMLRGWGSVA